MTYAQRLRQLAARTALDSIAEEMLAIADSLEQQASAQVQGEPVYQYRHADGSWSDQTRASYDYHVKRGATNVRVLYTTPQPAQATQPAEVTDAAIDAATRHLYHNGKPTSKEYRVSIARAILALRPAAVPMTDEPQGVCNNGECAWGGAISECRALGSIHPLCPVCGETVEPCGITTQAKKEGV